MYEPPLQFDPKLDQRPVRIYATVLVVLLSLPWFGVECLFNWCVVQGEDWIFYTAFLALPFLLFLEFPLRWIDRARGKADEDEWVIAVYGGRKEQGAVLAGLAQTFRRSRVKPIVKCLIGSLVRAGRYRPSSSCGILKLMFTMTKLRVQQAARSFAVFLSTLTQPHRSG